MIALMRLVMIIVILLISAFLWVNHVNDQRVEESRAKAAAKWRKPCPSKWISKTGQELENPFCKDGPVQDERK